MSKFIVGSGCSADCFKFVNPVSGQPTCRLAGDGRESWLMPMQPLAGLNTLRLGGPAAWLACPESRDELFGLLRLLKKNSCPWRVMGRGSNLLIADKGVSEVVIRLGAGLDGAELISAEKPARQGCESLVGEELKTALLHRINETKKEEACEKLVFVEAGAFLPRLINDTIRMGLSGLEFLAGVPASLGGAVMMNAGAWGDSIGEHLIAVEVASAEGSRWMFAEEFSSSYRAFSGLRVGELVLAAVLKLLPGEAEESRERCRDLLAKRVASQPQKVFSAGSFFRNPQDDFAGRLIEAAGLKGRRVGGAMVAEEHANFLVNTGAASAADMLQLMRLVQNRVMSYSGLLLRPEVALWGFADDENG